jgi:hypothetical protein
MPTSDRTTAGDSPSESFGVGRAPPLAVKRDRLRGVVVRGVRRAGVDRGVDRRCFAIR